MSLKAIANELDEMSQRKSTLDSAYDETMHRIHSQRDGHRAMAMKALSWITHVRRPLTTGELQHALAIEIEEPDLCQSNIPDIEEVVSRCAGLVIVDQQSQVVRLVHYSAQEYFEHTRSRHFPKAQLRIAQACLTYLRYRDIGSGLSSSEECMVRSKEYALLDYAAFNWNLHARYVQDLVGVAVIELLREDEKRLWYRQAFHMAVDRNFSKHKQVSSRSALHICAFLGLERICGQLIDQGVTADIADEQGCSPLELAAARGHEEVVRLLLDRGASIEGQRSGNYTPYTIAACAGAQVSQKILAARGANTDLSHFGILTSIAKRYPRDCGRPLNFILYL